MVADRRPRVGLPRPSPSGTPAVTGTRSHLSSSWKRPRRRLRPAPTHPCRSVRRGRAVTRRRPPRLAAAPLTSRAFPLSTIAARWQIKPSTKAGEPPRPSPLKAAICTALRTSSGRIEIFSEAIASFGYEDCPGHPAWLEPAEWLGAPLAERYPLHLVSNQPTAKLHSQFDPGPHCEAARVGGREVLRLHPDDAAARGIATGDLVRVFNDRGACLASALVTGEVMPRVAVLPTGVWYAPEEPGVPGSLELRGNPNVLTLDKGSSRLAQAPVAHSCLVEVERVTGEVSPAPAYGPPPLVAA